MNQTVTQKLIRSHLVDGRMSQGEEIGLTIDQTLTQDATGTMVMLEFEALQFERVKTELSIQYIDHNLLQTDHRNADDHLFLLSACRKYGIWYSRPGNGVSHAVHMERFGGPGKTLLGSDSHTCSAGSMGMLAIGAGGLEVALAMAGEPFYCTVPIVKGIRLTGNLPEWVSAKDVILELLRRHDVKGGVGKILEYYGPGLDCLSAMDRHTIANMGAELGATTSVFPSDDITLRFLKAQGRHEVWKEILADRGAVFDEHEELNLSELEPMVALPGSPGNVVPVRSVVGKQIHQSYIGSSANPGLRDIAIAAHIVEGKQVASHVSFDINPASRQVLENLVSLGLLQRLIHAGARVHEAGCNGCIGMGQAPATGTISLRTVPRNFPGRSGTKYDEVYLCSPETAAASALNGTITDPRDLGTCPVISEPEFYTVNTTMFCPPERESEEISLVRGPNIKRLPHFEPLPLTLRADIMLKAGDNISTDDILPAGASILPLRSNIPEISKFVFSRIDVSFTERVAHCREKGFFIVAGTNYGQGSSREHAAIAPRFLGLRAVLAKSFSRIHHQNLINFGVVPLCFVDSSAYDRIEVGDTLLLQDLHISLQNNWRLWGVDLTKDFKFELWHSMTKRQIGMVLKGGLINYRKKMPSDRSGF